MLTLLGLALPPPPADGVHVVDTTGELGASGVAAAEAEADRWAERTGNDVLVAVVDDLDGATIEDYTAALFESWQPGQPGVDNGVLVVVALDDRELRVEAGRGLVDQLDVETAAAIAGAAIPHLRDGDLDAAVLGLVTDVVEAVDEGVVPAVPRADDDSGGSGFPAWVLLIPVAGLVLWGLSKLDVGSGGTSGGSSYGTRRRSSFRSSSRSSSTRTRTRSSSSSSRRGGRSSGRGSSRKW